MSVAEAPPRRLFCVPYAGGSARAYRGWQAGFGDEMTVVPLELPGRGDQVAQPRLGTVAELAVAVSASLRAAVGPETSYVLFGHSLGALVAFEVAAKYDALDLPAPAMLVVSGRNPPHVVSRWADRALRLSDAELLAELRSRGGLPDGLSASLAAALFLPTLRADLAAAVGYRANPDEHRLDVPLSVVWGRTDPLVDSEVVAHWSRYTTRGCILREYDGDHFSVFGLVPWLAATLRDALDPAGAFGGGS
jgi:surfactin synthase thioesterase subunit